MSIFKNPMILMGLVSVVMIFGMPKLMENSEYFGKRKSLCLCAVWCQDVVANNTLQWTTRRRRTSRRCSRTRLEVKRAQRARCRTSILRASCLGSLARRGMLGRRRRSNIAYCSMELQSNCIALDDKRIDYHGLRSSYSIRFKQQRQVFSPAFLLRPIVPTCPRSARTTATAMIRYPSPLPSLQIGDSQDILYCPTLLSRLLG